MFCIITVSWCNNKDIISDLYNKFLDIGILGVIATFFDALCNASFVIACVNTYTANVYLIYCTAPILVAILSYYFLNEVVHLRTILAAFVCFICVGWIFYIDLTSEESGDNDDVGSQGNNWYGNLMALVSTISFSIFYILIRKSAKNPEEDVDMIPVLILSALLQCIVSLLVGVDFSAPTKYNYAYLFLQGGFELPLFYSMTIWASKYIPATEMQLMLLLDNILQPLWTWIFGFSTPPDMTLILGSVMIVTIGAHSYLAVIDEDDDKKVTNYMIYNQVVDTDMDDDARSLSVETPTRRLRNDVM